MMPDDESPPSRGRRLRAESTDGTYAAEGPSQTLRLIQIPPTTCSVLRRFLLGQAAANYRTGRSCIVSRNQNEGTP